MCKIWRYLPHFNLFSTGMCFLDIFRYCFGGMHFIRWLWIAALFNRQKSCWIVERTANKKLCLQSHCPKNRDWSERWTASTEIQQPKTMNHNSCTNKIILAHTHIIDVYVVVTAFARLSLTLLVDRATATWERRREQREKGHSKLGNMVMHGAQ